jgi:hypothetical protein
MLFRVLDAQIYEAMRRMSLVGSPYESRCDGNERQELAEPTQRLWNKQVPAQRLQGQDPARELNKSTVLVD